MLKLRQRKLPGQSGTTLVEVMAVALIAGIALTGLVAAYVNGIAYWRTTYGLATLSNEGSVILNYIAGKMRTSITMIISSNSGPPDGYIDITYLAQSHTGQSDTEERRVEFYYMTQDHTLRMNDVSGGVYGRIILPMVRARLRRGEEPYLKVMNAQFVHSDPLLPDDPAVEGYSLITLNLTLQNVQGDTMSMSTTISRYNNL